MAKSARASGIKKNKAALKKRVFGPVETARNDRLSAKLLELAKQPKPAREEMGVEASSDVAKNTETKEDGAEGATEEVDDMETDGTTKPRKSNREIKRRQVERAARVTKRQKPRNQVAFPKHPKKKGGKR